MCYDYKLDIKIKSNNNIKNRFRINSSINARKDRLTEIIYSKTRQMFAIDEPVQLITTYKKNTIIMNGIVTDFANINFVEDIIDTNNVVDYIYSNII